jgi:hypothetical protein
MRRGGLQDVGPAGGNENHAEHWMFESNLAHLIKCKCTGTNYDRKLHELPDCFDLSDERIMVPWNCNCGRKYLHSLRKQKQQS